MFGKHKADKPEPSLEELRIRQLELELQVRKELTAAADQEIERCRKVYDSERNTVKGLASIISAAVILMGSVFGMKTCSEVKTATDNTLTNIVLRIQQDLQSQRSNINERISTQLVNIQAATKQELEKQFQREAISNLIFKAADEKIHSIAESIIAEKVLNSVLPLKSNLQTELLAAKQEVKKANEDFSSLQQRIAELDPERQLLINVTAIVELQGLKYSERLNAAFFTNSTLMLEQTEDGFTKTIGMLGLENVYPYLMLETGAEPKWAYRLTFVFDISDNLIPEPLRVSDRLRVTQLNLTLKDHQSVQKLKSLFAAPTLTGSATLYWNSAFISKADIRWGPDTGALTTEKINHLTLSRSRGL